MKNNGKAQEVKIGDVVIINRNKRNRALWKLGIVEKLLPGKSGVVRAQPAITCSKLTIETLKKV